MKNFAKIRYQGQLELYCEQGMESPIFLFNATKSLPGHYNWITLKEIKKIAKVKFYDRDQTLVYEGPLTFQRDAEHMVMSIYDFRPVEFSEKDWMQMHQKGYTFDFDCHFVISSLKEMKSQPYILEWSGNEDHSKPIELLLLKTGFPLYYKDEDSYMQSFHNVLKYDKITMMITYENGSQMYLKKADFNDY